MQIFAFIDYDNVRPIRKEVADEDTEQNLLQIAGRAVDIAKSRFGNRMEVVLRLYDGWIDINGRYTERGLRMLRVLGRLPRRIEGVQSTPEMVVSPFSHGTELRGLVKGGEQKMVDSLVVTDLTWCALTQDTPLIVMSDDDDMVPGIISALVCVRRTRSRQPICLSRVRQSGEGLNDQTLIDLGVCFEGAA